MKFNYLIIVLLFSCVFALASAKDANAISDYDQTYRQVPFLEPKIIGSLANGGNCINDISSNWTTYVTDSTKWSGAFDQSYADSFTNAVQNNGSYGISLSETKYGNAQYDRAIVYWTESTNGAVKFETINGSKEVTFSATNGVVKWGQIIYKQEISGTTCEMFFIKETSNPIQRIVSDERTFTTGGKTSNYFVTAPVTYPTDYAGLPVFNGILAPTLIDVDYFVNFNFIGGSNGFSGLYKNKTTVPSTGLADPTVLTWSIIDLTDTNLGVFDSLGYKAVCKAFNVPVKKAFSKTEHCPDLEFNVNNKYAVSASAGGYGSTWLETDQYFITYKTTVFNFPTNGEISTLDSEKCSTIPPAGEYSIGKYCTNVANNPTQSCFLETFPFITFESCIESFQILINNLSFNTIKFGNSWETSGQCRQLSVLGGWLSIPNYNVCPQFPQVIRDIITPFITLAIGLLMIRFLTTKEGYLK